MGWPNPAKGGGKKGKRGVEVGPGGVWACYDLTLSTLPRKDQGKRPGGVV